MPSQDTQESPTRRAVTAMHAQGHSTRDIAEALRITEQAVHKHLKKMGVKPNPPTVPAS
jgi:DNA-binding NarL/FixJ family response regulator